MTLLLRNVSEQVKKRVWFKNGLKTTKLLSYIDMQKQTFAKVNQFIFEFFRSIYPKSSSLKYFSYFTPYFMHLHFNLSKNGSKLKIESYQLSRSLHSGFGAKTISRISGKTMGWWWNYPGCHFPSSYYRKILSNSVM